MPTPRPSPSLLPLGSLALLLASACATPSSPGTEDTGTDTSTDTSSATTEPVEPDAWGELVDPVAGTRLRPVYRTADDGTRVHIRWHDTMFDVACEFSTTSDGALRCIPIEQSGEPWLYGDASCTEPVLQTHEVLPNAEIVMVDGHGCFDESFYEVGELVTGIYYNENGPCEPFSGGQGYRVFPYPVDGFVSATVTPAEGNSRIVPLVLEADDGSRQIVGAWDNVNEEQVVPDYDAADQWRWFGYWPSKVSPFYYADAACTERVALSKCVPAGERPRTALETDGNCGPQLGRYELLEEIGTLYDLAQGSCAPANFQLGTSRAWRVGAPIDDIEFAEAPAIGEVGPRLRHDVYCNPEGEPFLSSRRFYDLMMDEAECVFRDVPPLGIGTHECIPVDAPTPIGRYNDPACTEPVAERELYEGQCYQEPRYAYAAGLAVAVLGPAQSAAYQRKGDGTCDVAGPDGGSDGGGGADESDFFIIDDTEIEVTHAVDLVE